MKDYIEEYIDEHFEELELRYIEEYLNDSEAPSFNEFCELQASEDLQDQADRWREEREESEWLEYYDAKN